MRDAGWMVRVLVCLLTGSATVVSAQADEPQDAGVPLSPVAGDSPGEGTVAGGEVEGDGVDEGGDEQSPRAPLPTRPAARPSAAAGEGPQPWEPPGGDGSPAVAHGAPEAPTFGAVALVPSPGTTTPLSRVPRNVLTIDSELLADQHVLGLQEGLALRLGSVSLNNTQNNPLQPDIQYRGYTASPLLGSPQGIALYQNGARINESFGDVIQWDLVPEFAIGQVQVTPGANPLYGLNALGGSIALKMKNGFDVRGPRVSALAGSFARRRVTGEVGHVFEDGWAVYAAASAFGEEGFRTASRSSRVAGFADLRRRDDRTEVGVSLTAVHSDLNGNGPAPVELLAEEGRGAVYTYPDNTDNSLLMLTMDGDRELSEHLSVQATAYLRHVSRATFNGDEGEFELCDAAGQQVLCSEDGDPVLSEQGDSLMPTRAFDGLVNTTDTATNAYGGSLQLTVDADLVERPNQLLIGATYDSGDVSFGQRAETAYLTADRTVIGQGDYLGGDAFRTRLTTKNRYLGVYVTDTFTPVDDLSVQASARFNYARVQLNDLAPSGALDGKHNFTRLNPSLGVTYAPTDALGLFASYGESNRVPSPAELACADPEEPCRLPNAFIADPPLSQVVSRSVELGLRGHVGGTAARPALRWSVAAFGSRNNDDILFVAGSLVGTGYFRNAGDTQRMGLELDASGEVGPVAFFASYTLQQATFRSELSLPGAAHPNAIPPAGGDDDDDGGDDDDDDDDEGGELAVSPGDRMPGVPTHSLKLGATLSLSADFRVGVTLTARSGTPLRGDEANLLGDLPGYAVVGASASYQLFEALSVFLRVQNLLDTEYETFGIVADPSEVLPGRTNPRFVSPGAPLAVFAGLVLEDF